MLGISACPFSGASKLKLSKSESALAGAPLGSQERQLRLSSSAS